MSPDLTESFFHFFDKVAFADNPDWSGCYCCYYQLDCSNEKWNMLTKEQNRFTAEQNIRKGKVSGYLAFENNVPVAWVNVNARSSLPRLKVIDKIAFFKSHGEAASVVCFVVSFLYRGKGLARKLLRHAIADCTRKGFDSLEAYPRLGENLTPADQFHGPLQLYLSEGFDLVKEYETMAIVQRKLKG